MVKATTWRCTTTHRLFHSLSGNKARQVRLCRHHTHILAADATMHVVMRMLAPAELGHTSACGAALPPDVSL